MWAMTINSEFSLCGLVKFTGVVLTEKIVVYGVMYAAVVCVGGVESAIIYQPQRNIQTSISPQPQELRSSILHWLVALAKR